MIWRERHVPQLLQKGPHVSKKNDSTMPLLCCCYYELAFSHVADALISTRLNLLKDLFCSCCAFIIVLLLCYYYYSWYVLLLFITITVSWTTDWWPCESKKIRKHWFFFIYNVTSSFGFTWHILFYSFKFISQGQCTIHTLFQSQLQANLLLYIYII